MRCPRVTRERGGGLHGAVLCGSATAARVGGGGGQRRAPVDLAAAQVPRAPYGQTGPVRPVGAGWRVTVPLRPSGSGSPRYRGNDSEAAALAARWRPAGRRRRRAG